MAHLGHYKEAHPLMFVVTHWVNLVCMVGLIFTGLLIHFPFLPMMMGIARGLHMACAFLILINLVVRIVFAFIVKDTQVGGTREGLDTDIKNFLPNKRNRHQLIPWIKYYLFFKKDHPMGTKYGSPQKICYFLVPFVLLASVGTGLCLWGPTSVWPIFQWATDIMGGAMNVRIIHYVLMWLFIIFIIIHVYLATVEGTANVKIMFLHKETPGLLADPDTGAVIGVDRECEEYDELAPIYGPDPNYCEGESESEDTSTSDETKTS